MKAFFYFDNSNPVWNKEQSSWVSPVIFWIERDSILEADKEINQALNIKVEKMAHISCRIIVDK